MVLKSFHQFHHNEKLFHHELHNIDLNFSYIHHDLLKVLLNQQGVPHFSHAKKEVFKSLLRNFGKNFSPSCPKGLCPKS